MPVKPLSSGIQNNQPLSTVKGVMAVAPTNVHQAAWRNDSLLLRRAAASLARDTGTSAAVKLTGIGCSFVTATSCLSSATRLKASMDSVFMSDQMSGEPVSAVFK